MTIKTSTLELFRLCAVISEQILDLKERMNERDTLFYHCNTLFDYLNNIFVTNETIKKALSGLKDRLNEY